MQYSCQELISWFNDTFAVSDNTILVRAEDEPIYLPADERCSSQRIIVAHAFLRCQFVLGNE